MTFCLIQVKENDSLHQCALSLPAYYFITEFDPGIIGVQPHNFITIGGVVPNLTSFAILLGNNLSEQFRWMGPNGLNISTINSTRYYLQSDQSKPSAHQLIINTSSAKFKIVFLNESLPQTGKTHTVSPPKALRFVF